MNIVFNQAADLLPLLEGEDFDELVEDIRKNGLREPIWIHPDDGSVVDGRNRHRACIAAGVQPTFRTWDGQGSLLAFVVSLNVKRRHLTPSQRAALAECALPMLEAEARKRMSEGAVNKGKELIPYPGESREKAAEMFDVNPRYISDAKRIKEASPDLFNDVLAGKKTIPAAMREQWNPRARMTPRQIACEQAATGGLGALGSLAKELKNYDPKAIMTAELYDDELLESVEHIKAIRQWLDELMTLIDMKLKGEL